MLKQLVLVSVIIVGGCSSKSSKCDAARTAAKLEVAALMEAANKRTHELSEQVHAPLEQMGERNREAIAALETSNALHCASMNSIAHDVTPATREGAMTALNDAKQAVSAAKRLVTTRYVDATGKTELVTRADAISALLPAFEQLATEVRDAPKYSPKLVASAKEIAKQWCPMWDVAKKIEPAVGNDIENFSKDGQAKADTKLAEQLRAVTIVKTASTTLEQLAGPVDRPLEVQGFEISPFTEKARAAIGAAIDECR